MSFPRAMYRPPPRHRHHHRNFPPEDYTDLAQKDVRLLTHILGHVPSRNTSAFAAYEKQTQESIAQLPDHLRAKHPMLSTICSIHEKLNPLPIMSLFNAIRDEVEDDVGATWIPLMIEGRLTLVQTGMIKKCQDLSAIWTQVKTFQQAYGRRPERELQFDARLTKCAACVLAQVGSQADALIALGACLVGRVSTSIWKKSKRIQWIEAWISDCVSLGVREKAVAMMWRLGQELRKVRVEDPMQPTYELQNEPRQSPCVGSEGPWPRRPRRAVYQNDHLAVLRGMPLEGLPPPVPAKDVHFRYSQKLTVMGPSRDRAPGTERYSLDDQTAPAKNNQCHLNADSSGKDDASSLYSDHIGTRRCSECSEWWSSDYGEYGDKNFRDLYCRTHRPETVINTTPGNQAKASPDLPRAQEAAKAICKPLESSLERLKNITIIDSSFRQEEYVPETRTSKLWRRRVEASAPRLCVGRNGEVKGPEDSASDLSLMYSQGDKDDMWINCTE